MARPIVVLFGVLRDLDAVVQQTTGQPMVKHAEKWWQEHGRPYFEQLQKRPPSTHPLEADYALLGLTPECSDETARYSYKAAMKRHHPDKGGDPELAKAINLAWGRIRKSRGIR